MDLDTDPSFASFLRDIATVVWRIPEDDQTAPSGIPPVDQPPAPGCASCGACCKGFPGPFYPADLGPDRPSREARARVLLESGSYAIDWWEDPDPARHVYFLRPSIRGACGQIFDPAYRGQCALLGPRGCTLDRAARPMVCRALPATPESPFGCRGLTKRDVRDAWVDDSDWLRRLGEQIQEERGG